MKLLQPLVVNFKTCHSRQAPPPKLLLVLEEENLLELAKQVSSTFIIIKNYNTCYIWQLSSVAPVPAKVPGDPGVPGDQASPAAIPGQQAGGPPGAALLTPVNAPFSIPGASSVIMQ